MAEHGFPGGEDAFVAKYLAPLAQSDANALGLKDDAATITHATGHALVVTCDTLIQDRHFHFDGSPESAAAAAHKALAVNVSDLVAKAAKPRAYLLSLSLPPSEFESWMPAFTTALAQCQKQWGLTLIGGDTVRSPDKLALTITAIGEAAANQMITRAGAMPGDVIFVSGTIGDAFLGLQLARATPDAVNWLDLLSPEGRASLVSRSNHPTPRTQLIDSLRTHANAAIDVSDGFVKDLGRLCAASGVGADVEIDAIPLSPDAMVLVKNGVAAIEDLIAGGDDYEVIACIPASMEHNFAKSVSRTGVRVTRVGTVSGVTGLRINRTDGTPVVISKVGWDHLE